MGRTRVAGVGDDVVVESPGIADHLADAKVLVDLMVEGQGSDIGLGLLVVARLQAIEGVAINRQNARGVAWQGRDLGEQRDAVVGHVVTVEVVVAGHQLGRAVQADRDRRRDAPAVEVHRLAARNIALRAQHIEADGDAVIDLMVHIDGGADIGVRPDRRRAVGEVVGLGALGAQIDAAAARAAAAIGRVRPLDDFHLLQIEHLAGLAAAVADAIDEDVVARGLAADERTVGQGLAALARAKGDAGRVAQDVLQRGGAGLLNDPLRDDGDGLGGVDKRRGQLQ